MSTLTIDVPDQMRDEISRFDADKVVKEMGFSFFAADDNHPETLQWTAALIERRLRDLGAPPKPRRGMLIAEIKYRGVSSDIHVEFESSERRSYMVRVRPTKIHCSRRMAQRVRQHIPEWIDERTYEIEWIDPE